MDEDFLLVQKMRMGDENAFDRFVTKYYPAIMICAFTLSVVLTGTVFAEEMMIQFFLPYIVTCCICFWVLSSNRMGSEVSTLWN